LGKAKDVEAWNATSVGRACCLAVEICNLVSDVALLNLLKLPLFAKRLHHNPHIRDVATNLGTLVVGVIIIVILEQLHTTAVHETVLARKNTPSLLQADGQIQEHLSSLRFCYTSLVFFLEDAPFVYLSFIVVNQGPSPSDSASLVMGVQLGTTVLSVAVAGLKLWASTMCFLHDVYGTVAKRVAIGQAKEVRVRVRAACSASTVQGAAVRRTQRA
jgi:hypothetical protein